MNSKEYDTFVDDNTVVSILPLDLDCIELNGHPSIILAQDECDQLMSDNYVEVLHDEDLNKPVVEIYGPDSRLIFNCTSVLRYLVMFVKNMDQFFHFEIEILDETQKYRTLSITNKASVARVQTGRCQLPLKFGLGWRYLCVDLHDLVKRSFGTEYLTTVQIRVFSTCRIFKLFLQDKLYSDAELPQHLRLNQ